MSESKLIRLTVLVPAYNEEATIVAVLEKVRSQHVPGVDIEVVVVNDGSTDRTREILDARPELYDKVVHQANGGKGAAVKAGLRIASGDFVLFQDADLEYDPGEYERLLRPVLEFDAEIVMGSRVLAPKYTRVHYFWHKVGNRLITLTFNILNNTTFTDIYSCYLLYRRDLVPVDDLRSEGWEQHAEILSLASKRAGCVYEVPVSYHGRSYAEGKKIKAHHTFAVLAMIARCALLR